nr:hypothetical protein [Tanacetum cinerariifolium]
MTKDQRSPSMKEQAYNKKGDDEEVLTYDELSNHEEENLRKDNEIAKVFRIEMDIFLFETPLCKELKEFNHLLQIHGKKEEEESSEDAWSNNLPNESCRDNNDNDVIQASQEWFDDHEPLEDDDDDNRDLDDYFVPNNAPYYVDEEEERFK